MLIPEVVYAQQFNFRNYSVGDGLAQSQVYAMLEDRRGYIWMGTRGGGLSRFDGRTFRTFTERDGLIDNYILGLCEDLKGNLWIGTNSGISYYDGIHFQNYALNDSLPVSVGAITQSPDGTIWLGTSKGIFRLEGRRFVNYSRKASFYSGNYSSLRIEDGHSLWAASDNGIFNIDTRNGTAVSFNTSDGLGANAIQCLALAPDGRMLAGTYGGGLSIFDESGVSTLTFSDGICDYIIFDILPVPDGRIWLATQNAGVCIWNPADTTFSRLTTSDGLANAHVRCMIRDSWGNIWLGTSGGGVSKYYGQQFEHLDRRSGLPGNYIYSIHEDRNDRLWMGVSAKGVVRIDSSGMTTFGADSGFADVKVKAIFEDPSGQLWLGTEGLGLAQYISDTFRFFKGDALGGNWVRDICGDTSRNIWAALAGGGISKLSFPDSSDEPRITRFRSQNGLPHDRIECLLRDKKNRIWFATRGAGIGYLQHDKLGGHYTKFDGLPLNTVRSLAEDDQGNLWIGTAGGGVCRMPLYEDSVSFETYGFDEGLSSQNIYLLALDDEGNLWIGSESGVDMAVLEEGQIIEIKHYGRSEGFVGIETCQNSVLKDKEGNLLFGTINGLTRFNPHTSMGNPFPPKLSISQVDLFYQPLIQTEYADWVAPWGAIREGIVLPWRKNNLSFDFVGIDHKNPEMVRYQWMMEGSETNWSPPTFRTTAMFANLSPGDYNFRVRAINEDGVSSEPVEASFKIRPPFWQSWWFRIVAAAAAVLLIGLVFRIRLDQVRRKAEEERERISLEKNLLQLEQKALQLQMNPHFIFNALNSIQALIVQKDEKSARYYLAKFSRLMRQTLENSREPLISLEDEIANLENYLSLEQFSRGKRFSYQFDVPENLDLEEIMIPPMLLQPFAENAIIHGVGGRTEGGEIRIGFEYAHHQLSCTIEDNGIGREAASKIKSQRSHHRKSMGLQVTRERLAYLGENTQAEKLEITDLFDAAGKPAGTRVQIRIPV